MNRRDLLGGFVVVLCLTTLWGVWSQRSQLAGLRAEHQQLLAQMTAKGDGSASPAAAETGAGPRTPPPALVVTPELLRLRSEVTRLTERRRELAGERTENERLRAQLAARGTNGPGGYQLPPGYMRRSEARLLGYDTVDDALQSLLWAVQHHDLTNILRAFVPDRAELYRAHAGEYSRPIEEIISEGLPSAAMRIVRRELDASDGSIAADVELETGEPGPRVTFRQIDGQWKIAGPF
jgi:hypothetical protein